MSKVDDILEEAQSYIDDEEIKSKARSVAKAELLKLIEQAAPEKFDEITADDMPLSKAKREGWKAGIDTYLANIDELFKGEE